MEPLKLVLLKDIDANCLQTVDGNTFIAYYFWTSSLEINVFQELSSTGLELALLSSNSTWLSSTTFLEVNLIYPSHFSGKKVVADLPSSNIINPSVCNNAFYCTEESFKRVTNYIRIYNIRIG